VSMAGGCTPTAAAITPISVSRQPYSRAVSDPAPGIATAPHATWARATRATRRSDPPGLRPRTSTSPVWP
jgi:hypothetical protein